MENGHTIAIQHADNLVSVYKHNSALLRKLGAQVKAGEAIAIIGNTGTLTQGPHLHFELWYQDDALIRRNTFDLTNDFHKTGL